MSSAWSRLNDAESSLGSAVLTAWNGIFAHFPVRLQALLDPVVLMVIMITYLPRTLFQHPLLPIANFKAFQHAWFGNFWKVWGPQMAMSPEQTPYIARLCDRAKGIVLDLGPGGGDQMKHFRPGVQSKKITKIVSIEPAAVLHPSLRQKATEIGLSDDQFLPLVAGAEPESLLPALRKAGLLKSDTGTIPDEGVFDTIICIKSMCSAPQHEMKETVLILRKLLKPGGEFLFFEHVDNGQDPIAMAWAWVLGFFWRILMGGCNLDGKIDVICKNMGGWTFCETRNVEYFKVYQVFRYCVGICRR